MNMVSFDGRIPGNTDTKGDVIGFISHMDTSSDAPGHDIHPPGHP